MAGFGDGKLGSCVATKSGRSLAVADRRTDAFHDSVESGGTCGRAAPRNDLGFHGGLCHPAAIGILDESMASGELCDVSAQPVADPGDRNGAQSGNLADAGWKPVHDPDRRDILQPEGYSKKGVIRINMKEIQLKVTDANKKIHGNTILENVSLTMTSGKIYGLQGSNGSGKTMLMRAMCGLIRLNSGTVEMNGKILGKDMAFLENTGILIESPAFLNGYTGLQNLMYLADIQKRVDRDAVRHTIERVGLDPDDKRKYRKYSLGMKQRLGIAAAIMEQNDILLIDEPFNALDVDGIELVKGILLEEKARGALIVLSCHERQLLESLSDELYLIQSGKIMDHIVL